MKRTWPIIGVADVGKSNEWYLGLLSLPHEPPHHDDFAMITDTDNTVLVCLHKWSGHGEGPPLESPATHSRAMAACSSFAWMISMKR